MTEVHMPTRRIKGLGYKPDLGDFRDYPYQMSGKPIPAEFLDLREKVPPSYDQLDLGSCTANALCMILRVLKPDFDPSRLWLYFKERALEHNTANDDGAFIRDGVRVLHKLGCAPEADWPYDVEKFAQRPPHQAVVDAKVAGAIARYERINPPRRDGDPSTLDQIHDAIANKGLGVVIGITCYAGIDSAEATRTGIIPEPRGAQVGGHALACFGYKDGLTGGPNSWSPAWGDNGWFWLHDDYVDNPDLTTDIWVIYPND